MASKWQGALAGAGAVVMTLLPQVARADLAELTWGGRFGEGRIVYERNAPDLAAADQRGSFLDNIRSFELWGIQLPYGTGGIDLAGTTGSMRSEGRIEPCNRVLQCESSSVSFLLGASHQGDPLHYKVTFFLPFLLDSLDQLPLFDGGGIPQQEGREIFGSITSEFNSPATSYITAGYGSSLSHRLLPAAPVPEPGALLLFGLGAGVLAFVRRRA